MKQQEQKWLVLLYSLNELDGGAQRRDVLQYIKDCNYWYKNDQNDILLISRNEFAWRNDFSYERQHLVEKGYMESNGNGKWNITLQGKSFLLTLIEKAINCSLETNTCYTAVFYQKLIQEQNIDELEEDQILINALSQTNCERDENQFALLNEPLPIEPARTGSNRNVYPRSAAVSQRVLNRAGNLCEINPEHISFLRRNGVTLYMEPHHLIPMGLTGYFGVNLDREQNIFSLCSNCHNQIHYGTKNDVRELVSKLFLSREQEICSILGRTITLEELYQIYKCL